MAAAAPTSSPWFPARWSSPLQCASSTAPARMRPPAPDAIGSPWPKHAVSASRVARRRNDRTVCARSWWKHAEHDLADVGDGIAGEQHAMARQMDRDAADGVTGYRKDLRAATEFDDVA